MKRANKCLRGWVLGAKLGEGSFGSVRIACKPPHCRKGTPSRYVMKISILQTHSDVQTAERDVFFLTELQHSGMVPRIVDSWLCGRQAFMVLERFDGDLYHYLKKHKRVLPKWMLDQVRKIALKLGTMGVYQGDSKLDNWFYNMAERRVVLGDFGFAGVVTGTEKSNAPATVKKLGWSWAGHLRCKLPQRLSSKYVRYLTLWDVEQDLMDSVKGFRGFGNTVIPREVRQVYRKLCPGYLS